MPQRRIVIPEPIALIDPDTGKPDAGPVLDFAGFIAKLWSNPLWNESWKHGLAQQSIARALKDAIAKDETALVIAEEDWGFLVEAAKAPRSAMIMAGGGVQVVPGIGYLPSVAGQIIPMQLAIINAELV